ncbi:hypothetical protein [Pedobacter sp.]|uniref:hypothetical protein n=1 Tax=Pedobacter sp. TaxID=1411316 RepID=UPI003D7F9076
MQQGEPSYVYNHPSHVYTAQLLGNANALSLAEADQLGLHCKGKNIIIYPEWVELKGSLTSRKYEVMDVYYKGFYEELLLERNGVRLRAIQLNRGEHQKKDFIQASITKFLSFE